MLSGLGNGNGDVADEAGVDSVSDIANGNGKGFQLPGFFTEEMVTGVPNWVLMGGAAVAFMMFSGRR